MKHVDIVVAAVATMAAWPAFAVPFSLPCDSTVVRVIPDPAAQDTLGFTVVDQEVVEVSLAALAGSNFNPEFWIESASGALMCGGFGSPSLIDCGPLAVSGNPYRVLVQDGGQDGVGTYQVHLQRFEAASACDAPALPCDVVVSGALTSNIDSQLWSFTVASQERVEVSVRSGDAATFQPQFRIIDAHGVTHYGWVATPSVIETGPLPASGNPYRLEIMEAQLDAVGTYTAHLQRIAAAAACDVMALPCDTTLRGALVDPLDTDLWSFTVTPEERVEIAVRGLTASNFDAHFRVLDANGVAVSAWVATPNVIDVGPLAGSGNPYRVEIIDSGFDGAGSYDIHLQRFAAATACGVHSLACDATMAGAITSGIDSELYGFSVAAGEIVELAVSRLSGTGFSPQWRLIDATGVTHSGWHLGAAMIDTGPLPAGGNPYRLEVIDQGLDATGTFNVHLQRFTPVSTCDAPPIPCDSTRVRTLASNVDSDLFSFAVTGTEIVELSVSRLSGINFNPAFRVVDASGVTRGGWWGTPSIVDCGPLPASGNPYRIEVIDSGLDATGTYNVRLQRTTALAACDAPLLRCDSTRTGTIDSNIDSDLFEFGTADGERFDLSVVALSGINFDPLFRVVDHSGAVIGGWWGTPSVIDVGPLAASGNPYRVEVIDNNLDAGGTYNIHMQRLSSVPGCDRTVWTCQPDTFALDSPVDSDLFTVAYRESLTVSVSVAEFSGLNFQPVWRLLDASGAPVPGCGSFQSGDAVCGPPPSGDPCHIEVIDSGLDAAGSYRILVGCDPTSVGGRGAVPPAAVALRQNQPNPFNPSTTFHFELPKTARVRLDVLDLAGRVVAHVVDAELPAGYHQASWTVRGLASGIYVCRLRAGGTEKSTKITLLK